MVDTSFPAEIARVSWQTGDDDRYRSYEALARDLEIDFGIGQRRQDAMQELRH